MNRSSVLYSMFKQLCCFLTGFIFVAFILTAMGTCVSIYVLLSGNMYFLEYSLKLFLVAVSILVLLELNRDMRSVFTLVPLTALFIMLSYAVYVERNDWVYLSIFNLHILFFFLLTRLATLLFSASRILAYLFTLTSTYLVTSLYIVVFHLHSYISIFTALLVSFVITTLYSLSSRSLGVFYVKIEYSLHYVFTKILLFSKNAWSIVPRGIRVTLINSLSAMVEWIKSQRRRTNSLTLFKIFMARRFELLGERSSKSSYSATFFTDKTKLELGEYVNYVFERFLGEIVEFYRRSEDEIIDKIRLKIVKGIEILHHVFEYSLMTTSLILGLLILLALMIYILLVS